jgi:hypothetical protein
MTKKRKSLQESWLRGVLDKKYPNQFEVPLCYARCYFQSWRESELRECWDEFESILTEYINKIGKKHYITNPLVIITRKLYLLFSQDSFRTFIDKWFSKPQIIQHPLKINLPVYLEDMLGALFILKNFSIENMCAVMDMHAFLSENELHKLKFSIAEKDGIRKNSQRAAKADRRKSYTKLIDKILSEDPNIHLGVILRRLNEQTEDDKKICLIKSVQKGRGGYICYYLTQDKSATRTVPIKNVASTVSKIRRKLKNKLP